MRPAQQSEYMRVGNFLIEVDYDGAISISDTVANEQVHLNISESIEASQFINACIARIQKRNREEVNES